MERYYRATLVGVPGFLFGTAMTYHFPLLNGLRKLTYILLSALIYAVLSNTATTVWEPSHPVTFVVCGGVGAVLMLAITWLLLWRKGFKWKDFLVALVIGCLAMLPHFVFDYFAGDLLTPAAVASVYLLWQPSVGFLLGVIYLRGKSPTALFT